MSLTPEFDEILAKAEQIRFPPLPAFHHLKILWMTSPRNVKLKEIELANDFIVYVSLLALTFLCRIVTYSQADSARLEKNDNRYFNGNGPDILAEAMSESLEGYIHPCCMWTILIDILLIILQLKENCMGFSMIGIEN